MIIPGTATVIEPTFITEAMLTTGAVAEPDTGEVAWTSGEVCTAGLERYIGSPSATVTISNGSPAVVTWTANGIAEDTPFVFSTTGTPPAGVTAGTLYYVKTRLTVDTFTFSDSKGGLTIKTTSAGSGTHTATAQVHMVYEALDSSTGASPMVNSTHWAEVRPTNRWGALDRSIGTVTSVPSPLTMVLRAGQVTAGAALEISGAHTVEWSVKDQPGGTQVYYKSIDLESTRVEDVYDWFFKPVTFRSDVAVIDLPGQFFDPEVTVTITGGTVVDCGVLIVGTATRLGGAQKGAEFRIMDFSTKATDAYGRTDITERAFSKQVTLAVVSNSDDFETIARTLAGLRAQPAVYIGSTRVGLEPLLVYGIPKDWSIDVAFETHHLCSLQLEGLSQ